jgi:hypothetical protein
MTFTNVDPGVFAQLEKELADSHQAVMVASSQAAIGDQTGTITHEGIVADYEYAAGILTVTVVQGGSWIVNRFIQSKVQAAIDAIESQA